MSVIQLYDPIAETYSEVAERSLYAGPQWLGANLPIHMKVQPARIADLACANGLLGKILRHRFPQAEIVGVDVTPRMIEQARESGVYDKLIVHDLNEPIRPHLNPEFDLIVGLGFSEFLKHPPDLLKCLSGLLSKQGVAMFSFQEYLPSDPKRAPRTTRSGEVIHNAYSRNEVEMMFHDAGLHLLNLERIVGYQGGGGFLCLYLMAIASRTTLL